MRTIGFHGGHTICELGPAPDVRLFFKCLELYAAQDHSEQDWSLLTDRLYRRYLRREELDSARALMAKAREIFAEKPAATSVEWDAAMLANPEKSWLNPGRSTLTDVFGRFFEKFVDACESAESFFEAFNIYQPVRVVISDLSGFTRYQNRPLSEYDALEGEPFWLK